jgi:hypothetical protein
MVVPRRSNALALLVLLEFGRRQCQLALAGAIYLKYDKTAASCFSKLLLTGMLSLQTLHCPWVRSVTANTAAHGYRPLPHLPAIIRDQQTTTGA